MWWWLRKASDINVIQADLTIKCCLPLLGNASVGDGRDRKLSDTNMINMRQEVCFQGWISTETSSHSQAHWCMSKQEANSIKHSIVNNCFYCTARAIVTNVYVRIFIQACYYLVSLSLHFFFCLKPIGLYFWKENMASCLLSCFALCLFVCMKVLTEATGSERCTLKNSCAI